MFGAQVSLPSYSKRDISICKAFADCVPWFIGKKLELEDPNSEKGCDQKYPAAKAMWLQVRCCKENLSHLFLRQMPANAQFSPGKSLWRADTEHKFPHP